ncbi:MAG: DNA polymerase III subunit delta [Nitrosomonas sp.]|nr:DNA polymerase III subunit delta [Nitrosomonas sp.]
MRISLDRLAAHLQKQMAPLYVLFGDETLLILEAIDLILSHARQQGYTEREIYTVEQHFKWQNILNADSNLSLFGTKKIIDIRIPSGKPGKEGGAVMEAYCTTISPDVLTLITLPRIDQSTQNTQWFKSLENFGVVIPVSNIERQQLPEWIAKRLAQQQQRTDATTLEFMADQVEGNLLAAYQEIQKLALIYPAGNLTLAQIRAVIFNMARYDIYQLADALIASDANRYSRILNELQEEGTAPLLILNVLAEQIRQLITIQKGINTGQSTAQLLRSARIWGNRQKIVLNAAQRIHLDSLHRAILHAARIDRMIKGVADGDIWNELSRFINILATNFDVSHALSTQ